MKSRNFFTKGLSLLLALIMVLSIIPMSAITASAASSSKKVYASDLVQKLKNCVSSNKTYNNTPGYCVGWVNGFFSKEYGLNQCYANCANEMFSNYSNYNKVVTNNVNSIPIGSLVFFGHSNPKCYSCSGWKNNHKCGHVGIYIGNNQYVSLIQTVTQQKVSTAQASTFYGYIPPTSHFKLFGNGMEFIDDINSVQPITTAPSVKLEGATYTNGKIALGKTLTLKWDKVGNAKKYIVNLDGKKIHESSNNSCSATLSSVGLHTFEVTAQNDKYSKTSKITCEALAPVTAKFYDNENTLIESKPTDWNTKPIEPANIPSKEHYEFKGWSPYLSNITADTSYTAQYEKEKYKVRFFAYNNDGEAVQIGTTQTVKYLESATEPSNYLSYVKDGMEFAGWSCDFSSIEGNTDVYLIEKWYNDNMKIKILDGATALRDPDGYTVNCTLQNNYNDKTVGRIIVAVKTAEGKLIYTTESAAFTIKSGMKKSIEVYVPCEESGTVAEIFAVEKYTTALPISAAVKLTVDQGNAFTNWSTEKAPADALATETKTQYRYRDKETKASGYASLPGYTQTDKKLISTTYGNYCHWSQTATSTSDSSYSYERSLQYTNAYRYNAFYNSANKSYYWYSAGGVYNPRYISVFASSNVGADGYDDSEHKNGYVNLAKTITVGSNSKIGTIYTIWDYSVKNGQIDNSGGRHLSSFTSGASVIPIYRTGTRYSINRIVTKKYQYTHYRWLDWSEWSDNAVTANDNRQVETQTLYRYKANDLSNIENTDGVVRTISGKVDASFAGREADLFIYKYNEASDWTNQYIGQCTIGADGSYSFTFKLRSEPSLLTGDYTATLGIEGTSAVIDISSEYEWLKAPLPKHTVSFYDANGNVISTQSVVEGQNAVIPDIIPELEGYTFVGWSESNINVTEDLIIAPIMKINTYSVTFIDWENQKYEVKTFEHGDTLVTPEIENVEEGYNASWDAVLEGKNTVTENMVVCSVYEKQEFTVNFYDYNNNVISTQTVKYGESAMVPELPTVDNITFEHWDNYDFYEVKDNLEVHPVFLYDETVATPVADIDTGVYSENLTVSLTCATDGAKILYTLDGTDPIENGIEYFEPISIQNSLELNFIAVKEEYNNSPAVKKCYALNKEDMTSEWMTYSELPDYVLANTEAYSLNYRAHGYKYKDTLSVQSVEQADRLRRSGWSETDSTWTDYTDYSVNYPEIPDNEIEILTKLADPYESKVYTYTHYKYFNSTTKVYEYSNKAVENTVGETETIKLTEELTSVASFINGEPAFRYNGELWFYEKEGIETVTPDYNVYSYRTKVFNFYKWTPWDITPISSTETREYLDSKVYSYTMPNRYVVKVDYTNSVVENIKSNDSMLIIEGQKIILNQDYFNIEGYTLEGVYTDADYKNEWNFENDIVNENITLYPKYSVSTFTVKFLDYDNSVISGQEVEYLNYANVPDDPTREGFVFVNWECIEGTLTDGVTSNITYMAKYIAEEDYTRVSLSRSKISMITGSETTIKATVMSSNPNNADLIWYSSNTEIATVDSLGNITAVHSGTAIITVMSLDTYETANCTVTVLGTLDTEILPVSNSGVTVDASAKYLLGINRGENTINLINNKLQNSGLVYTDSNQSIIYENNAVVGTGCRIQLKDVDETIDQVTLVIYGDVNGDGAVDAFDAIEVDISNNTDYELENEYAEAADVNGDGIMSTADYAYITAIVRCNVK